jgi:peptide/nickel transport system permease protein
VSGRADVRTEIALNRQGGTGFYLIDAIASGNPAYVQDVVSHAVLPAMVLGLVTAGIFLRLVRTNVIGTFNMPYVDAARSRGISEYRLVRKHAYKPALIPIITVIGLQIALLLGGAVLTETTFEWQGLGFQLTKYLAARDFVAVQGIVALIAILVALTNFVVDVIAAFLDPRVRY